MVVFEGLSAGIHWAEAEALGMSRMLVAVKVLDDLQVLLIVARRVYGEPVADPLVAVVEVYAAYGNPGGHGDGVKAFLPFPDQLAGPLGGHHQVKAFVFGEHLSHLLHDAVVPVPVDRDAAGLPYQPSQRAFEGFLLDEETRFHAQDGGAETAVNEIEIAGVRCRQQYAFLHIRREPALDLPPGHPEIKPRKETLHDTCTYRKDTE